MLISHKDHNNTNQVYSVSVMTHVKALEAGQFSQGTSEPITPKAKLTNEAMLPVHVQISKVAHRTILMECQNKLPMQCTHSADPSYNCE